MGKKHFKANWKLANPQLHKNPFISRLQKTRFKISKSVSADNLWYRNRLHQTYCIGNIKNISHIRPVLYGILRIHTSKSKTIHVIYLYGQILKKLDKRFILNLIWYLLVLAETILSMQRSYLFLYLHNLS